MDQAPNSQTLPGALAGLHVIELGHHIAGSYASKLLADLGADVTKVEGPGGDPLRKWGPSDPSDPASASGLFQYLNVNKRGITADLQNASDASRVRELAAHADVLVENFRPGRMEAFGLGPDQLLAPRHGSSTSASRTSGRPDRGAIGWLRISCCRPSRVWRFALANRKVHRRASRGVSPNTSAERLPRQLPWPPRAVPNAPVMATSWTSPCSRRSSAH